MQQGIVGLARNERCALYNELSHMTPYYLDSSQCDKLCPEKEKLYHIRNLKLLSLYFDRILIPIENVLAFANNRNKVVVESVVTSTSFRQMIEMGFVSFCGWGAPTSRGMLEKGISYALKDYRELKTDIYLRQIIKMSEDSNFFLRDSSKYDIGHDTFLHKRLCLLDGAQHKECLGKIIDFTKKFYSANKYIGSIEFYRMVDNNQTAPDFASCLYYSYYIAWQQYCYKKYAPVITVSTQNIGYNYGEINVGSAEHPKSVLAILYSPGIFLHFITWQLGENIVEKLLSISPYDIQTIRNGDGAWSRFADKYHKCIEASSDIHVLKKQTIFENPFSDKNLELIAKSLFTRKIHNIDSSFLIDVAQIGVTATAWINGAFNPVSIFIALLSRLFKKTTAAPFAREAIPFYRKTKLFVRNTAVMQSA